MKRFSIAIFFSLLSSFNCFSQQENKIPSEIVKKANNIVELIIQNRISELAAFVMFPIKMPDPIPNIETTNDFIKYYPVLFDSTFKQEIINSKPIPIWQSDYSDKYGLYRGQIWIDSTGNIISITPIYSPEEKKLVQKLNAELLKKMHPSIKPWKENILICTTNEYYIRIDYTDDGLRYISWKKGKQISDQPDLILYNGIEEPQGSHGGFTFTFVNENWSYEIDDLRLCETAEKCGLFLRIFLNGKIKNNYRCERIK